MHAIERAIFVAALCTNGRLVARGYSSRLRALVLLVFNVTVRGIEYC